jgi:hypothetical protein
VPQLGFATVYRQGKWRGFPGIGPDSKDRIAHHQDVIDPDSGVLLRLSKIFRAMTGAS